MGLDCHTTTLPTGRPVVKQVIEPEISPGMSWAVAGKFDDIDIGWEQEAC
jgi:hypothetical protein